VAQDQLVAQSVQVPRARPVVRPVVALAAG
jgi:hypothetical protein